MVKRIPKFTPRKNDRDLLKKLNKSLYNKERRLNIEFGKSIGIQRKKITDFVTRKDFNEYVKTVQFHTHRNQHRYVKNAKGLVVTRGEYSRIKKLDQAYQRKQKRELNKIREKPMRSGGKDTGHKVKDFDNGTTMGLPQLDSYKIPVFDFDKIENLKEWEMKQRKIEQRGDPEYLKWKNTILRDNYLTAIRKVFGHGDGIDEADMGFNLFNHIENMELNEFISYYMSEFDVSIGFLYNSIQKLAKLNRLHNIFGVEELNAEEWVLFDEANDFSDDDPSNYWI